MDKNKKKYDNRHHGQYQNSPYQMQYQMPQYPMMPMHPNMGMPMGPYMIPMDYHQMQYMPYSQMNQPPLVRSQSESVLYIGNLDENVTKEYLYNQLSKYGTIKSFSIDSKSPKKRYGIVIYSQSEEAKKAIDNLNHETIGKKQIVVTHLKQDLKNTSVNESSVFVKNIPKDMDNRTLDSEFSKYGNILSSKIACDGSGRSLGYGYIQFESKDDAKKCLEESEKLNIKDESGNKMVVSKYKKEKDSEIKNNLFIKNVPNMPEDQVKEKCREIFGKYGEIFSILPRFEESYKKYYVFICYKNAADATKAKNELSAIKENPFDQKEEPLYINWAEKKEDRKKFSESKKNQTTLYTKNLLNTISEQDLKKCFSVYGNISNICVKLPKDGKFETKFALIEYSNSTEAGSAIQSARENPDIKNLYNNKAVYLAYFHYKEDIKEYKEKKIMYSGQPIPYPQMPQQMYYPHQPPFNPYPDSYQRNNYNNKKWNNNRTYQNYQKDNINKEVKPNETFENVKNDETQSPDDESNITIEYLRNQENIDKFLKMDQEKQRTILGELLFPLVSKIDPVNSPKITGMLIDLTVFDVPDIMRFLENETELKEKVGEAQKLIVSQNNA